MSIDHVKALELAREGRWDEAHRMVQAGGDPFSCLIHAYLHRKEGDLNNAKYWYQRADAPMPVTELEEEWRALFERFR